MEENITHEKYLLAIGAVPFDLSKYLGKEIVSNKDEKIPDKIEECYQNLLKVFRESPSISKIEAPEKLILFDYSSFGFEGEYTVLHLWEPIYLECSLPERLQKIDTEFWAKLAPNDMDASPNFSMLYDGICFAFYRPMKNPQGIPCGASDARKMLQDIIKLKFDCIYAAPTPLRERFIINLCPNDDASDLSFSINSVNDIEITTKTGISNPDTFIKSLFDSISFQLRLFYSLSNCTMSLNYLGSELDALCQNILTKRFQSMNLSPYNLLKRREIIKNLDSLIHTFYASYSKWSRINNETKVDIAEYEQGIDEPLNMMSQKLVENLKVEDYPISTYLNIVDLGQKTIENYRAMTSLWITLGVSLIAAILGGIIGALFAK